MNLNQLRYMKSVATFNSFSLAAQNCHVTQPTLSNAIAQLETELGAALFHRSTRVVSLSPFGQKLLPYIDAILSGQEELRKVAQGLLHPEQKLCRLAMSPVIDSQLLSILVDAFSQKEPEMEFIFKECRFKIITIVVNHYNGGVFIQKLFKIIMFNQLFHVANACIFKIAKIYCIVANTHQINLVKLNNFFNMMIV